MPGNKKCEAGCTCKKHVRSAEYRAKLAEAKRGRHNGVVAAGFSMSGGYRILTGQQGHPLVNKDGALAEHRKVLYDDIGPGPHPCHWCGVMLDWGTVHGIIVDHLDEDTQNNVRENLVPSCYGCNLHRGRYPLLAKFQM